MKISIEKKHFNMDNARPVFERRNEMQEALTSEEIQRAACFYTEDDAIWGIYDVNASICRHVGGLYTCESDDPTIDCWVEMLVETLHACYRIEFYVFDFWQLASGTDYNNSDEVRSRACIRKFVEAK